MKHLGDVEAAVHAALAQLRATGGQANGSHGPVLAEGRAVVETTRELVLLVNVVALFTVKGSGANGSDSLLASARTLNRNRLRFMEELAKAEKAVAARPTIHAPLLSPPGGAGDATVPPTSGRRRGRRSDRGGNRSARRTPADAAIGALLDEYGRLKKTIDKVSFEVVTRVHAASKDTISSAIASPGRSRQGGSGGSGGSRKERGAKATKQVWRAGGRVTRAKVVADFRSPPSKAHP